MLQGHLWPEGERNRIYFWKKPSNEGFFFIFTDCLNVLNSKGILQYKQLLNIMIKINTKLFSIFTAVVLILPLSILDADDQLFGGSKEKGYLYYLDKQGDVSRSKMARAGKGGGNAEKVATAGVTRESGYLYFIDKNGDVARSPMARGRKK